MDSVKRVPGSPKITGLASTASGAASRLISSARQPGVLLGQGRRLFDNMPPEHIELDLVRTLEANRTLHLRYQVRPA
jgi:hypothetical protein